MAESDVLLDEIEREHHPMTKVIGVGEVCATCQTDYPCDAARAVSLIRELQEEREAALGKLDLLARRCDDAETAVFDAQQVADEELQRAESAESTAQQLTAALEACADELDHWGWGDMHYGQQPQEQRVVKAVARARAALTQGPEEK